MSAHLPPVPEDNRSRKGTGETKRKEIQGDGAAESAAENPEKLGHQGNTIVNTPFRRLYQDR